MLMPSLVSVLMQLPQVPVQILGLLLLLLLLQELMPVILVKFQPRPPVMQERVTACLQRDQPPPSQALLQGLISL